MLRSWVPFYDSILFSRLDICLSSSSCRPDSSCRKAFSTVLDAVGGDYVPLESGVSVNLPLNYDSHRVWVNHSRYNDSCDYAVVESDYLGNVLEAIGNALENNLVVVKVITASQR